jgi:polyisoprenoid-binding protein YceI
MICRYLRVLLALVCIGQASSAMAACWTPMSNDRLLEFTLIGYNSPDPAAFLLRGHFDTFSDEGTLCLGDTAAQTSTFHVTVQMGDVEVEQQSVTKMLQSADFFDVAHWPTATFVTTSIEQLGDAAQQATFTDKADAGFNVKGKLTLRGVTRDVTLAATMSRKIRLLPLDIKLEKGQDIAVLDGTVSVNRLDYNIGQNFWGKTDYLSDRVNIHFSIYMLNQTSAPAAQSPKVGNR